ncbi:hypothetical protein [Maricaulis sp.]|uniref:hypothetical protein n=1 Tax=Maricaulis sp. TaxID=1486257 RepID=UPI002619A958|nr:hypothetical protein [Maricaulis sp.]
MIRHLVAVLALLAAMLAAPLHANAQTEAERASAFASWSQEMGLYAQEAVNFVEVAGPAYEIMADIQTGATDRAGALSRIDAWRRQVDAQMTGYRDRGAALARGPRYTIDGQDEAVALMRDMPAQVIATITGYFETVETQARDLANGVDIDPYAIQVAQLALLQDYYAGLAAMNRAAGEGVLADHPQHHLLFSMTVNMESFILALEVARQRMGGAPSSHAVDDFAGALADNQREVQAHIAQARRHYERMVAEFDAARGVATGEAARQIELAASMFNTYPASFDAELSGAAIFSGTLEEVMPITAPERYEAWLTQLTEYEGRRDSLQLERQRLGTQF